MNKREYASAFLAVLVSLTVMSSAKAEVFESTYSVTQSQGDYELITDMLVGPGVALRPSGHMIDQTEPFQIGIFSNLVAQVIPSFTNGVILSNGIITDGPSLENAYPAKEWDDEGISLQPCSDRDINEYFKEDLLVNDLYDPAGLVLYIQPKNKTINIPFVMASEEFYLGSYVPDSPSQEAYEDWSDKFAFFLQELGTASECLDAEGNVTASAMQKSNEMLMTNNIARLPGGGDVEIASVNQHTNSEYFISNVELKGEVLEYPGTNINLPMEFNGAIVGPVAVAEGLDTNKVYKLKIMLADYGDNTLTSVVFLRDRGISSGADLKIGVTGPAYLDNYGTVTFTNVVSNIGPATADGVVVTNYLPVGANYISCEKNAGEVTGPVLIGGANCLVWTIGDRFQHGSNAVMTVKCDLPVTGFYTNSAVVVTTTGDYDERNNADEWIAQVGGDIQNITVCAISTNMAYGSTLAIPSLQFIKSIVGTNGTDAVTGVDVNFYDGEGLVQPSTVTVGTYRIVLSNIKGGGILPSANVTYVDGLLTVTQRVLTIIANSTNRVYGSTLAFDGTEFTTKPAELPNGETVTNVKITSKDGVAGNAKATAGEYPGNIIPSHVVLGGNGFKTNNYDIVFSNGTLTVDKRAIEITPKNRSKVYGKSYPFAGIAKEVDITKGSLAAGDKIAAVKLKSAATAKTAAVGTYEITASNAAISSGAANYTIAYAKGKFLVTKSDLTIIANSTNKVYGTRIDFTGKEFTTDPATLPNGDTVTNVTITSEMATNLTAEVGVYTNEIVPSHAVWGNIDTNNYDIVFSNGTLTVTKAPLTIIADGTNRVYGTTVGFTGREFTTKPLTLPNNEKIDAVTITSTYAGVPTAAAGTYLKDIVPSHVLTGSFGFKTNNYDIVFSNGTLTVIKAPLTIIANSTNKVFGTEVELDGTEFTTKPVTLPNHETVTNVTLTCPQTTNLLAAVGTYPIVPSHTVWGEDFNTNNYAIVFSNGTLKVTQAGLTVIANDTNKVYNTTITFAGNEFTTLPATLPEGIAVDKVTLTSAKAASAATAAGTYKNEIVPSEAQGTGLDNYKIAYSNGTLKVTQAALTVIANDASKVYNTVKTFTGTEFTTLPATLPNGDAVTSVTLASAKAADALTDVGTYVKEIQPSAAVGTGLGNYAITYSNGTLTVTKAGLTVIANDASKVYNTVKTFTGKEFATLPATLPAGVTVNSVTLTSAKAADAATAAGTYKNEIVPSDAVGNKLNNYDIAYSNGTLTVTKAALTVIANSASKAYGTVKTFTGKEFTTLPASLPAGVAVNSVTLTSAKAASAATAAGTYENEIVPSAAVGTGLGNYSITYSKGTLTVTKVPLAIIADDKSRVYGSTLAFTGKEFKTLPTALPNGDQVATVTITSAKGADASTVIGTYQEAIVPSHIVTGINTNNYDIVFSNGTLKVTQAALTVRVNDAKWNIKKPKPSYSFADFSSQLKGGDSVASVAGSAGQSQSDYTNKVWATAVPVKGDEGVYTEEIWIKLTSFNGPRASNYLITVDPGDLTVDTALPELKIDLSWALSGDTGLLWPIMTVENVGDGEVESDSNYWVELKPVDSPKCSLWSKTGTMPDGYDYQDLTSTVKAALKKIGNKDEAFDPGEKLTFDPTSKADAYPYVRVSEKSPQDLGVRVYHVNRKNPLAPPITPNMFFIAGQLFNEADTTRDFKVSDAEKTAAAAILGTSSADYLEVTRLNLLQYYHWNTAAGTWIGPSK